MQLIVDVAAEVVRLGSRELRGQWVDFYAALASSRAGRETRQAYVTAEAVARSGPWRHKAPGSVGKEIARHLVWLKQHQLGHVLGNRGRTKAWRLELAPAAVSLRPDPEAVRSWVGRRSAPAGLEGDWAEAMRRLVEGAVNFQCGQAEATLARLDAFPSTAGDPALEAWAALLRGRAALQHGDAELLQRLCADWLDRADATGRNVAARLRALDALQRRFKDPAVRLASLGKLAADLELRGDVAALASVLNVMGLLCRRTGAPRGAMSHHLRSAALFGLVGDYPSLQGALFNLAKSRRMLLEEQGLPPDEQVMGLMELCRQVCRGFGVGGDSAQAEICGSRWAMEMGDIPRARGYMAEADGLVKRIESTFDQACFLLLRAELEHRQPTGATDPIHDLRAAERLFREVGDHASAANARRLREAYARR